MIRSLVLLAVTLCAQCSPVVGIRDVLPEQIAGTYLSDITAEDIAQRCGFDEACEPTEWYSSYVASDPAIDRIIVVRWGGDAETMADPATPTWDEAARLTAGLPCGPAVETETVAGRYLVIGRCAGQTRYVVATPSAIVMWDSSEPNDAWARELARVMREPTPLP